MRVTSEGLEKEATSVGMLLRERGLQLATAESCTGGGIAEAITRVAGSSVWFDRGFVTYSNEAKIDLLGVPAILIEEEGAVSEAVVRAMALGALMRSRADVVVAVTGIAGPGGGSIAKPVGTVWFAWQRRDRTAHAQCLHLDGDRAAIRRQSVHRALAGVSEAVR